MDDHDLTALFASNLQFVLEGAAENPSGSAEIVFADARNLAGAIEGPFDQVVTSPPYANRMSYVRELRPYLYWLGFIGDGRAAGELDWQAIGGTWGIATSRLSTWEPTGEPYRSELLENVLAQIREVPNRSARVLANYVAKYCDDLWNHFQNLPSLLVPGADLHYIVGNSSFYGLLVPVEQLYAEMLQRLGFEAIECRPIRKRNSNKALIEFDVTARFPK